MELPEKNLLLEAYRTHNGPPLPFRFEQVTLPAGAVLYEADTLPRYVHFVTSGGASIVATLPDGDVIEIGFVGNEGCPESLYLLGPQTSARRCVMQVGGTALRLRFRELQEALPLYPLLQQLTLRWVQFEGLTVGQLAACNGLHLLEQRLARWLLMVSDRIGGVQLPLTQDLLGQMLGARRASVTQTIGNLERVGLIEARRGQITLVDRVRLEEAACSCYRLLSRLYRNLYR